MAFFFIIVFVHWKSNILMLNTHIKLRHSNKSSIKPFLWHCEIMETRNQYTSWKVETPEILTVRYSNPNKIRWSIGQKSQRNLEPFFTCAIVFLSLHTFVKSFVSCSQLKWSWVWDVFVVVHVFLAFVFYVGRREPRYLCTSWGALPEQAFGRGRVVIHLTGIFTLWATRHRKT